MADSIKNENIEISYSEYPGNAQIIGELDSSSTFKIFIDENVLLDIDAFLASNTAIEMGGVLLGNVFKDINHKIFIYIKNIIFAKSTNADITRLTFTHKTWEQINNEIDLLNDDKKMLGWFHSHPGHSVFLSSYDKFIHENFFNSEFMVAYVFDPIKNEKGFFTWQNNSLERAKVFFLIKNFSKIENTSVSNTAKSKNDGKIQISKKFLILFLFANLMLTAFLIYKIINYRSESEILENLKMKNAMLLNENSKLNSKINDLQSVNNIRLDSILKRNGKSVIRHNILGGETLRQIAVSFYNDESKYNLLIRENNLKDEFDIKDGQTIEIPIE